MNKETAGEELSAPCQQTPLPLHSHEKPFLFRPGSLAPPVSRPCLHSTREALSLQAFSGTHPKSPKSQVLCQGALALTPCFLSHGHQAVVGNIL